MKLTEEQKELLQENDWDVISNDQGNCAWITFTPKDGVVFSELCEQFNLTGDDNEISFLVIGTQEGE
jgi:hypothetical protein